jgi:putative membrane protein
MNAGWWWRLLPYDLSPVLLLAAALCIAWYWRAGAALPLWRRLCFWGGMAALYVASQTGLDYYAEHAFFMHRLQHVLLHHLGPFLIALGLPAAVLLRWRAVRGWPRLLCHPWLTAFLFNALVIFWLVPAVHFPAMLDWRLYRLMNWGIAVNGLLFWVCVLRAAAPGAMPSAAQRIAMLLAVVPLQIAIGALIFLAGRDLYPVYELCGRAFSLTAIEDQQLGGLLLWVPGAMMSVAGVLVVAAGMLRASRAPA